MKRRDFLNMTLMNTAALALSPLVRASEGNKRPNIIFIMADDLGYGHLECYGQKRIRTPHLNSMAAEGMKFTQCYSGAPVCAPSRCTLMTGLHGGHASVRGNTGGIPLLPEDLTVAEILKESGYTTGLFGKWGLGEHGTAGIPNEQGFDEFFGWLHQIHAHFYYPEYLWHNDTRYPLEGNDGKSGQYAHDVVVEKAFDFVRRHGSPSGLDQRKPFFLYLAFAIPHYELLVPEDSLQEYRGKFPEKPYIGRGRGTGYPVDYAAQETPKAALAAMITRMDQNIGRLVSLLKELGIDDNTIIFFTSDNGASDGPADPEFFNAMAGLRGLKTQLYEGGIRVPMIVQWPGKIQRDSTCNHVCYFPDILPTLADLAGTESPKSIDGLSILPSLLGQNRTGKSQSEHEYLYWETDGCRALRMGNWKALQKYDKEGKETDFELYDLSIDPAEQANLADKKPDIAENLGKILQTAHKDVRPQIEPEKPEGRQYQ
ncbi:MAG TPA: arylsulfatase [bacterium]|nr:arylsulfatase [bacterium]HQP97019.1 arylsulfatase [bacterium]